jgi:hypothetical protein
MCFQVRPIQAEPIESSGNPVARMISDKQHRRRALRVVYLAGRGLVGSEQGLEDVCGDTHPRSVGPSAGRIKIAR